MRIDASLCDRCGDLHPTEQIQRTAHILTSGEDVAYKVIDHTDLELCPNCASIFNSLIKKFLEPL